MSACAVPRCANTGCPNTGTFPVKVELPTEIVDGHPAHAVLLICKPCAGRLLSPGGLVLELPERPLTPEP